MPRPRKSLICLDKTPYYHCVSRCVRRAYLCGKDPVSGKSFEHRRQWVEDRLLCLAEVFAIDVGAYAVMSNHCHTVLHVDKSEAQSWSTEEVLRRWLLLHKGPRLCREYMQPERRENLSASDLVKVEKAATKYRERLYSISWFMRLLNENIARQANKEDDCTGRFWEGRFKSQALLDEAALTACMAYVDLNPIRASIAATLETSEHTSIKQRIAAAKDDTQPSGLLPFIGNQTQDEVKGLPFHFEDYLSLVQQLAQLDKPEISNPVSQQDSPILQQTGLSRVNWQAMVRGIEKRFSSSISLTVAARRLDKPITCPSPFR